ncbi:MAG: protein BatD, partial [Pseudomonadales bacterium]|nr:protein BatD [Pseudomonadales bacterium]
MRTAIHRIGRSILVLLAFGCAAAQADLTATVDRNAISEFDLVTLSLRLANDPGNVTPDFSVVEKDFTIVSQSGPSRQSQFIFSNGQQMSESHTEWDITLRPKRKGTLTIPPIRVGNQQTQPIEIDVSAASASMTRRMNQYVFFDTSVDTHEAYVQGQIIYTVKLFYVDSISGDFPAPPNLSGAVVETIESEKRYESIVNNRRFYVLEKRYAIYPQQSGELVIPGERFNGARGRGSFFSAQEPVSAGSPAIKIDVKPRPASFTGEHWLPAKSVQLTESIKQDGSTLKVGEPFNRTLRITAEGLASSLLPPFAHLDLPNAKTYQDPPETNDSPMNGGVKSSLSTTIGIVPTEPGTLTLPAIEVPWWNTQTNKMEVARLPPHTFTVEPGNGATVSVPETPTAEKSSRTPLASDKGMPAPNLWMYVAIGFAVLWLITLWLWFSLRRQI